MHAKELIVKNLHENDKMSVKLYSEHLKELERRKQEQEKKLKLWSD